MNNKFNTLVLVGLIIASCGNEKKTAKTVQLTVANVTVNAADYVGKNVAMQGTVVHVCRHGGKRMFMIGEEPDPRFKITAGEEVGAFDVSLEGSDVLVQGVVQETIIDEAFLDSWEAELLEERKSEGNAEGKAQGEAAEVDDHHENAHNQIISLREQLAASDDGTISFYNLECESVQELE